ncbi:hypothetical protein CONCODRAFT_11507 [Conidiobolus coronatus NRRL 28638]|uniref:Uncharacterized protein n=1 Tax=Conidiobolus coronatus (strain ATCC 28846 / CBS 209.66 / NRRL 28638) TaxID=796925 RepID=A0A137NVD5_CONC2|nr:hypothetical protein CONCODRAFT_11507 [Conidiobolus coronatus NRRL 28638]|eukprot:KXN66601.1 hypothetical protein CONCODRAFT_11507 [Conidiobolus coronatus NRRL 28638]
MDVEMINILLLGTNIGFWCIGILFYIIQLTGPLTSLVSILYLFTIFAFGLCALFNYLVEVNIDNSSAIIFQICTFIFSNLSASYFAILVVNTYKVIERRWLYFLCALPLPMAIAVNLWCLVDTLNIFKIETGMKIYALSMVGDVLVIFTEFTINFICYIKFHKYKYIPGFKSLLTQYLSGMIFSLLIDVAVRIIIYYLQLNPHTFAQLSIASAYINLNIEFFLLNRIRIVLMSHIIINNS